MHKPSVTEVIGQVVDSRWFTEESAKRGTAVHSACAYLDQDDLDEGSVSDAISGYVKGWSLFKSETSHGNGFEAIEQRLSDGRYTGKPDRIIPEMRTENGLVVSGGVLDIKTGPIQWWVGLQIAAYCHLAGKEVGMAVSLNKKGSYKVKVYLAPEIQRSFKLFMALLSIWELKNK